MKWWYWLILFIPRLICIISSKGMFSRDGYNYLHQAQDMAAGNFFKAFSHSYPPLYALLTSIPIRLGFPPVLSGMLVSLAAAGLTGYCLYKICRHLGNEKMGLLALIIYSFHVSCIYFSADVLSDNLYGALLIASLCCMTLISENNSTSKNRVLFALSALSTGLCVSVRAEGLFVGIILIIFILLTDHSLLFKIKKASLFSFIILLAMLPGIWVTYKLSGGQIHLTAKYNIWDILGLSDFLNWHYASSEIYVWKDPLINSPQYSAHLEGLTEAEKSGLAEHSFSLFASEILDDFRKLFGPFLLLTLAILITVRRNVFKEKTLRLFILAMTIMLAIVLLNFARSHYVSHRHYFGLLLCYIPVLAFMLKDFDWSNWKKPTVIVMILFIAFGSLRSFKNPHRKKVIAKNIGLQCRDIKQDAVMCRDGRVAYYSDKTFINMPSDKSDFEKFMALRRKLIHCIVLYDKDKALYDMRKKILLEMNYKQKGKNIFYDE